MPTYLQVKSGTYSPSAQKYYEFAGGAEPDHLHFGFNNSPFEQALQRSDPVFHDPLISEFMADNSYNFSYNSSQRSVPRSTNKMAEFIYGGLSGNSYVNYMKNRDLNECTVLFALADKSPQAQGDKWDTMALALDPVAYWPLNDDGVWADLSGNGHHLTEIGSVTTAALSDGKIGAVFDGTNELRANDSPDFRPENWAAVTVSMWVERNDNDSQTRGILSKMDQDTSPDTGIGVGHWDSTPGAYNPNIVMGGGTSGGQSNPYTRWQNTGVNFAQDTSMLITFTMEFNRNPATGYVREHINGGADIGANDYSNNTTNWGPAASTAAADWRIGVTNYDNPFKGKVSKIAIYDRVLTPSEINSLYTGANETEDLFRLGDYETPTTDVVLQVYDDTVNPRYLRMNYNDGTVLSNGGSPLYGEEIRLVALTKFYDSGSNSTDLKLYLDASLSSEINVAGNPFFHFGEFGFGRPFGESQNTVTVDVSNLAIFDYVLSPEQIGGLAANLSIPDFGGWMVVAQGKWRNFLL